MNALFERGYLTQTGLISFCLCKKMSEQEKQQDFQVIVSGKD